MYATNLSLFYTFFSGMADGLYYFSWHELSLSSCARAQFQPLLSSGCVLESTVNGGIGVHH